MLKKVTLKDQIKALIIQRIIDGEYRSGDRLVELKIAREMGTSQAPVREALRELASLRMIENIPHKGTRVRSLENQELIETFFVRGALEESATRLATAKLKNELAPLKLAIKNMAAAAKRHDLRKVMEESTRFHRLIVEAAGNKVLLDTWLSLHIETHSLLTLLRTRADLNSIAYSHQAIVDAIATGDSEQAAKIAREHQDFLMTKTSGVEPVPARNDGRRRTQPLTPKTNNFRNETHSRSEVAVSRSFR